MSTLRRILVVDDEQRNRRLLEEILASLGHWTETASSGVEALEKINPSFDLVLMDLRMPGMDGFEVIRRMRDDPLVSHIPIIVATVLDERQYRIRAVEVGANDFVAKPIDQVELRVRVESLLRAKEAQDALKRHQTELEVLVAQRTEDLRASERLFRTVADFAYDWEYWISPDCSLRYVSPSCERLSGYTPDDYFQNPTLLEEIIYPDDREIYADHLTKTLRSRDDDKASIDFRILAKDGSVRWINHVCRSVHGEGGSYLGRRVSHRDISDRVLADQRLRLSQEQRDLAMMGADLGWWDFDLTTGTGIMDDRMHEILGYSPGEFERTFEAWQRFVHPDDVAAALQHLSNHVQGRTDGVDHEYRIRKKSGDYAWIVARGRIVERDNHHRPLRMCGTVMDITSRKQIEQERERLRSQLLHAQKMEAIGTLAAGVAHDFNNILQVVSGYSEILMGERQETDREFARLHKIYQASKLGADLVRNLLMFSRKVEPVLRPLRLNDQIVLMRKLLSRTIPKNIRIDLHLSDDLKPIHADVSQIGQVLMNLGVNARDAMPEGGTLILETGNVLLDEAYCSAHVGLIPGRYAVITCSDTGHGMDSETISHMFEPFFTTKESGKGTGLGLSTVYGIVKQHSGHITCQSKPTVGTTFKLYFPAVEEDAVDSPSSPETTIRGGTETILVVDDEQNLRDLASDILSPRGYNILKAANGKEAIDIFRRERERISLVILDLIMPEMDGRRCLEELLKMDPDARILVASGQSEAGPTPAAALTGAKGFVEKPYQINRLVRLAREAIDVDRPAAGSVSAV